MRDIFLNNKKHGIGIEYYEDIENNNLNIIKSKGEYLPDFKNGYFKEYFKNGKMQFEGKYLNNKKLEGIGYNKNAKKNLKYIMVMEQYVNMISMKILNLKGIIFMVK